MAVNPCNALKKSSRLDCHIDFTCPLSNVHLAQGYNRLIRNNVDPGLCCVIWDGVCFGDYWLEQLAKWFDGGNDHPVRSSNHTFDVSLPFDSLGESNREAVRERFGRSLSAGLADSVDPSFAPVMFDLKSGDDRIPIFSDADGFEDGKIGTHLLGKLIKRSPSSLFFE
jgi:hypothetical protein